MNIEILRGVARGVGVLNVESINNEQVCVRSIQRAMGHRPCFQSDDKYLCREMECEWRSECMKLVAEWMR